MVVACALLLTSWGSLLGQRGDVSISTNDHSLKAIHRSQGTLSGPL